MVVDLADVAGGELPAVEFPTPHPGVGARVLGDEADLDGESGRGLAGGFDVLNAVVDVVVVAGSVARDGHGGGVLLHGVFDTAPLLAVPALGLGSVHVGAAVVIEHLGVNMGLAVGVHAAGGLASSGRRHSYEKGESQKLRHAC